ncbi:unnamed protein product [Clavelina lepadiformis]|uniref:Sphingomyelin phosphodiesterase n=1 Tax=Clavelina lepadiformis TaxID=159417 RepID=A0ABP0FMN8_CLALP
MFYLICLILALSHPGICMVRPSTVLVMDRAKPIEDATTHTKDIIDHVTSVKEMRRHIDDGVNDFVNLVQKVKEKDGDNETESKDNDVSMRCMACVMLIKYEVWKSKNITDMNTVSKITRLVESGCVYFKVETPRVCRGGLHVFGREVVEVLTKVHLSAEDICAITLPYFCSNFHHLTHSARSWSVKIPPKIEVRPSQERQEYNRMQDTIKILHISDVHIDIEYSVEGNAECDEPVCCRVTKQKGYSIINPLRTGGKVGLVRGQAASHNRQDVTRAMKWGDYRNCDLPIWTFENLLQQLSKQPVDYIIFTGDIPAHDLWAQTRDKQLDLIFKVTSLLLKYFPETRIFPAVGNHDSFPSNNFPPKEVKVEPEFEVGWLYDGLVKAWSNWLPEDALQTVRSGGYYTTLVQPGFRIVSLNTNFCYTDNWWIWLDSKDPAGMLTWFVRVLTSAEENGELVHVIGHVPPGREPDCLRTWSENYYRIIERFHDVISAQFFGHTHYDEVQVFYNRATRKPISVSYSVPSVTPYSGMKPAYRFYDIEGFHPHTDWSVVNHQTYVLDLLEANKTNEPLWKLEYDACASYNATRLNADLWDSLLGDWLQYLANDSIAMPESLLTYGKYYVKEPPSKLYSKEMSKVAKCRERECIKNIVCDVGKNMKFSGCS